MCGEQVVMTVVSNVADKPWICYKWFPKDAAAAAAAAAAQASLAGPAHCAIYTTLPTTTL